MDVTCRPGFKTPESKKGPRLVDINGVPLLWAPRIPRYQRRNPMMRPRKLFQPSELRVLIEKYKEEQQHQDLRSQEEV
ncbi:hypothetical protein L596_016194 [Steinernema carpocapsae]|uniref:Uncharacterized protein n=1 Tax=Steinernema carpocapsae TaxID=34508 RepID=A0A4U5NHV5_STECR|nr:hypothetical protein L596_016194 [Steinernema carpocapsae]